jgi:hypothetical protein
MTQAGADAGDGSHRFCRGAAQRKGKKQGNEPDLM